MKKLLALAAFLIAAPTFGAYTINKSVCNQALVDKGACTVGQIGQFVNTAGRSSFHFSIANADLVELRDKLCPNPPAGETQNDCAARVVKEYLVRMIADSVVEEACQQADPNPDVE